MNLQEHRRNVLGKLGFVKKREGAKHEIWVLEDNVRKLYLTTSVSRNRRDISHTLRSKFCRQLHVSKKQYTEIASCNMSQNEYYDHLIDNNFLR